MGGFWKITQPLGDVAGSPNPRHCKFRKVCPFYQNSQNKHKVGQNRRFIVEIPEKPSTALKKMEGKTICVHGVEGKIL